VALTASVAVLLTLSAGARADPDLRSKRAQARAILEQVRALDEEVGAAAERWNGANLRLSALAGELRTARANLRRARVGYGVARQRASNRLVELYVSGPPDSALAVVLGANSLAEMLDVLEARERIADQDSLLVRELEKYRDETAAEARRIARARNDQKAVVERLAEERAAIGERLAERQRLLATVQSEVNRLERAERARQAELERRARAQLQRRRQAAASATAPTLNRASAPERAAAPTPTPLARTPALPPPAASPPSTGSRGLQVVAIAMRYLGVPYKWGGASPSTGFDCSGFTMYVFAQIGVSLPHYAAAQYQMGVPVDRSELEPGDLVFFRGLGHMGMYIGSGNFIHAPQTGDVVKISSLSEPYRVANWVGARRVL
jgi:cell wall-associated NlpC family hydrolase